MEQGLSNIKSLTGNLALDTVVSGLLTLIVCYIAIRIVKTVVGKALGKASRLDAPVKSLITKAVTALLWAVTIIIVAGAFGINATSLVALLSVVGLALSMSVQGLLGNFFSGIMLLIGKPFKEGDFIEAGDKVGIVKSIGFFNTAINTPDNISTVVPNSELTGATVKNYSREPLRRVDMTFCTSYDVSTADAKKAILDAIAKDERILADPGQRRGVCCARLVQKRGLLGRALRPQRKCARELCGKRRRHELRAHQRAYDRTVSIPRSHIIHTGGAMPRIRKGENTMKTSKKLFAVLLALCLFLSLSVPAFAVSAQYSTTKSFLKVMDREEFKYTVVGLNEKNKKEIVKFDWSGDNAKDMEVTALFTENLESVSLYAWNLVYIDKADLDKALSLVNKLNNSYYYVKFSVDEDEMSIDAEVDCRLRDDENAGELSYDGVYFLINIVDQVYPELQEIAKK